MDTSQRPSGPPLCSKRETYSLALFSMGFIAFSALVHMTLGSAGYGLFPHFTVEPSPSPQVFSISMRPHATRRPTPAPRRTATPPPPKLTPPLLPRVHPPTNLPVSHVTSGPTERPYVASSPAMIPPTAQPLVATPEPSAQPTPNSPIAIRDSFFVYKAPLSYPELAKEQGIQGAAVVLVTIGADGTLVAASIAESSGNASLDEAALTSARESRFAPYTVNGIAAEQTYTIVYEFKLG